MAQYFHVGLIVPIQHVLEDLFSQHHDQLFVIKSNNKEMWLHKVVTAGRGADGLNIWAKY